MPSESLQKTENGAPVRESRTGRMMICCEIRLATGSGSLKCGGSATHNADKSAPYCTLPVGMHPFKILCVPFKSVYYTERDSHEITRCDSWGHEKEGPFATVDGTESPPPACPSLIRLAESLLSAFK